MYPEGITVFIFDCSLAHEAFANDALMAHKMNKSPGGMQPKMHDTIIPATGQPQLMVFPDDTPEKDADGLSLVGKPKGMERVLRERGLLDTISHGPRGPLAVCATCKMSQEARDKAAKAAKSREEEIETGIGAFADHYECEAESNDLEQSQNCCMRRVLSLQSDFQNEKPLLQLVIEKASHKCLFLLKFHCELNPIEMVWGQAKWSKQMISIFHSLLTKLLI